jgi:hypothetical protein
MPLVRAPPDARNPLAEMRGQSVEVVVEAITGEDRDAAEGQSLTEVMDDRICSILGARSQMEGGNQFGDGIDGQPEPQHLHPPAEPGTDLVQLQMRQPKAAAEVVVHRCAVLPGARQPGHKGALAMAEHAHSGGHREPFGERGQHLSNAVGRGFQAIEWRHPEGTRAAC